MKYYILSINHRNPEALMWWRPDCSGYTIVLDEAGKYDSEVVNARRDYYDNKRETAAIPCHEVDEFSVKVVLSSRNMDKFIRHTEPVNKKSKV